MVFFTESDGIIWWEKNGMTQGYQNTRFLILGDTDRGGCFSFKDMFFK